MRTDFPQMQSDLPVDFTHRFDRPRARFLSPNGWLVLALIAVASGVILGVIV